MCEVKKKIGTLLSEDLFYEAKKVALSEKKTLSQLLEDALRIYLLTGETDRRKSRKHVVQDTRGVMSVSRKVLTDVMEEEGVYDV